jgi:hypothetical protein
MTDREIEDLLKKDKDKTVAMSTSRPTYTKMSRRHLSIETLNKYRIEYEFDVVWYPTQFPSTQVLTRSRILTMFLSSDGFQVRNLFSSLYRNSTRGAVLYGLEDCPPLRKKRALILLRTRARHLVGPHS